MKTFIALLIGGSLALAGTIIAQQPEGQESPAKKGGRSERTTTEGANETKTKSNAGEARGNKGRGSTESNATQPTTTGATGAPGETGATRGGKHARGAKSENANATGAETSPAGTNATEPTTGGKGKRNRNTRTAETGASASPGMSATPPGGGKAGRDGRNAKATPSPAATAAAAASKSPAMSAPPTTSATVAAGTTGATGAPGATGIMNARGAAGATGTMNAQGANGTTAMTKEQGTVGRGGKRVEQQQLQQIKQQHASFKAQARPDKAPAVTFRENYRIEGAEHWQGPQYEVFRSYHPERHDRGWYHQHYGRVELIAGGYYFFNGGYWYPAWGYDPSAQYYAYDGPIYVGHQAEPPDRVIADVQAELQDMGYYQGEVDGLLGPLTRQALRDYQADHGLMVTEVIDEPTLDALQLS